MYKRQALREGCFTDLVRQFVPPESVEEQWDLPGLERVLRDEWSIEVDLQAMVAASESIIDEDIIAAVVKKADEAYEAKVAIGGRENFTNFERMVLLQHIDMQWRDHLSALDYLRQGIHLRGYAQKQPKQEYKREAFELFSQMLDTVKNYTTKTLVTVHIASPQEATAAAEEFESHSERITNVTYTAPDETGEAHTIAQEDQQASAQKPDYRFVGRNDPCLLYTSPSPRDYAASRMPSSA